MQGNDLDTPTVLSSLFGSRVRLIRRTRMSQNFRVMIAVLPRKNRKMRTNPAKIRARPATTMSMRISTITSLSRKMNQSISSLLLAAKGVSQTASE